jgi:hypothetical protein
MIVCNGGDTQYGQQIRKHRPENDTTDEKPEKYLKHNKTKLVSLRYLTAIKVLMWYRRIPKGLKQTIGNFGMSELYDMAKYLSFICFCCACTKPAAQAQSLMHSGVTNIIKTKKTEPVAINTNPIRFRWSIPSNFHTQHYGFFCRQELQLQRANIPFAFRLGNMEQCNRLESK